MHIWTAVSFEDQLSELRDQCTSISEELGLANPSLTLPIHTSLAISFAVEDCQSESVITELTDYFSSLTPFSVHTEQIEQNGSIIWLRIKESPALTGIHTHLIDLLQRRYGIQPHPFDLDFQFHATLFFGGEENALNTALSRIKFLPLPETLTAHHFVIGTSPSGQPGTYSVCREIDISRGGPL